jgi:outer membrane receptor for ferrienterochelin and colicin
MQQHRNIPLFVNDPLDGKTFEIIYEPKLNQLQVHGEVEYARGEEFSAKASLNWNQFSKLQQEKKAWGILPFELNMALRWQVLKDLWIRSDLWAWDGPQYKKDNTNFKGKGAFDLNAGAEFRITKNFNLWLQMNNILNKRYERWNQYESFGFNILGGIVYSFNQKP